MTPRARRAPRGSVSRAGRPWVGVILPRQSRPLPRRIQSMKIAGSVAVITGGASGLGRATAERLLAGGGKVALLDLPKSAGVEVAKTMGGSAFFAACDVTSPDEVAAALEAAVVKLGAAQVPVNCAGIGPAGKGSC